MAIALVVAGAVVVGCGDTVIDSSKIEGAIQSDVEKSLHHKVSSVSCPSEQKVEPNATFTCAIVFSNGKHATETLKILNKDADVRPVDFKVNK